MPEEDAQCVICLADYEAGVQYKTLPCRHHYHATCIDEWLHLNQSCPLCMRRVGDPAEPTLGDDVAAPASAGAPTATGAAAPPAAADAGASAAGLEVDTSTLDTPLESAPPRGLTMSPSRVRLLDDAAGGDDLA